MLLLTLGVTLLSPLAARPQYVPVPLSSYEGQNVASLVLAGRPDINMEQIRPLLRQRAGEPFSEEDVVASINALKSSGEFKDVSLELRPDPGGVRVIFVLEPALYIGVFHFPGATGIFPYARLLQIANYQIQEPYMADKVAQAQTALTDYFHRSGFFEAKVKAETQIDEEHGLAHILFHSDLGRRAKFGELFIEGTTPEQTERLKRALRSIWATLRATSLKPGRNFGLGRLERATRYMQSNLGKQGFLAARVHLIGAEYDPETNRADVRFEVETGPQVQVMVEGTRIWPWSRNNLLPIYAENSIDPDLIQEGQRNLQSHLQSKGFFNVSVKTSVQRHSEAVTILYQVVKGERHKVESVAVAGNQTLGSRELLDHVAVKPARAYWPPSRGNYSQQLLRKSVNNLEATYRAAGFSSVKVRPDVQVAKNGNISVTFEVEEGPRDMVAALHIIGNNSVPVEQLAPQGLRLGPGKPYSSQLVQQDRDQIVAQYLRGGYLTATFTARAQATKQNVHRVDVTYEIYEGPKVTTTAVVTEGREVTRQAVIDRTARLVSGVPLSGDSMLAAESRLYELGIFDWASVDPRRPITTQSQDTAIIKLHEAKRNTISYGIGFEVVNRGGSVPGGTIAVPGLPPVGVPANFQTSEKTFWGPRGSFQYTRINVRGVADKLTVAGFAGRLDQRFATTYSIPAFRNSQWQASTTLSAEHDSRNPVFTARLGNFGVQFQRNLGAKRTTTLFLRYDFTLSTLTHLLAGFEQLVPPSDQRVRISQLSASLVQDKRDSPVDTHTGTYHSYELGIVPEALGSSVSFARFQGQSAHYSQLPAGMVWANSLRLGLEQPFSGSHVPIQEKFFSGGGSTLRGFPLDGAGPQQILQLQGCGTANCFIQVPTGGDQLLIVNSELRVPVPIKKGFGVVGFYDGGNVFATIGFHGQYTNTFGFGFRYATPIGPIRIDIGHNLNAPPGIKSTQVFVTVGQAF